MRDADIRKLLKGFSLQEPVELSGDDLITNMNGRLTPQQQAYVMAFVRNEVATHWAHRVSVAVFVLLMGVYFRFVPSLGEQLGPLICVVIGVAIAGTAVLAQLLERMMRVLIRGLLDSPAVETRLRRVMRAYDYSYRLIARGSAQSLAGTLTRRNDGEHSYLCLSESEISDEVLRAAPLLAQLETDRYYQFFQVGGGPWLVSGISMF